MISEKRKLEFWNFLISEKNQPRPKGITTQRLAVIRPAILDLDEVWLKVIGSDNIGERSAADFYASQGPESVASRAEFWSAVQSLIRQGDIKTVKQNHPQKPNIQSRSNRNSRKFRK